MTEKTDLLNRVVIPHLQRCRRSKVLGLGTDDEDNLVWQKVLHQRNPAGLVDYLEILFSQSAERVYVASPTRKVLSQDLKNLPRIARKKITFASPRKKSVHRSVAAFFTPIVKDAISAAQYDPRRGAPPHEVADRRHIKDPLVQLAREVYLLALGGLYQAQVDSNVPFMLELVQKAKQYRLSRSSRMHLALLEGVLDAYVPTELDTYRVSPHYRGTDLSTKLLIC